MKYFALKIIRGDGYFTSFKSLCDLKDRKVTRYMFLCPLVACAVLDNATAVIERVGLCEVVFQGYSLSLLVLASCLVTSKCHQDSPGGQCQSFLDFQKAVKCSERQN